MIGRMHWQRSGANSVAFTQLTVAGSAILAVDPLTLFVSAKAFEQHRNRTLARKGILGVTFFA